MLNADVLAKQAGMTAAQWMRTAVEEIDKEFGDGYASKHPELVSGFIQAAALDQAGMYLRELAER
ncbi:hypothetical protein [Raoultella ornithinolytica]|uniref:hypothetical protein n=1 Tax=Raoultella ornithinolytica TaxID=54291 RepID=UPI00384F1408